MVLLRWCLRALQALTVMAQTAPTREIREIALENREYLSSEASVNVANRRGLGRGNSSTCEDVAPVSRNPKKVP
jgi:hypothetical protein